MDLPPDMQRLLVFCGTNSVSLDVFHQILLMVDENILNSFSSYLSNFHESYFRLNPLLSDIFPVLSFFILETVKNSIGLDAVKLYLEECMWSSDKIVIFSNFFSSKRLGYVQVLQHIEFFFPLLIDASWKLDYYIKNKDLSDIRCSNYFIKLIVENQGSSDLCDISFDCGFEELQDFIGKLHDASKTIDKLCQF